MSIAMWSSRICGMSGELVAAFAWGVSADGVFGWQCGIADRATFSGHGRAVAPVWRPGGRVGHGLEPDVAADADGTEPASTVPVDGTLAAVCHVGGRRSLATLAGGPRAGFGADAAGHPASLDVSSGGGCHYWDRANPGAGDPALMEHPGERQPSRMEKILPLPLWEGVGGRGDFARSLRTTPPPSPLPQGEGESFLYLRGT